MKEDEGVRGGVFNEGMRLGEPDSIMALVPEETESFFVLRDNGEEGGDVMGEEARSRIWRRWREWSTGSLLQERGVR